MNNEQVLSLVKDFLNRWEYEIPVKEMPDKKGVANYEPEKRILEIDAQEIKQGAKREGLKIVDYITLVVSHELGHYLDAELNERAERKTALYQEIQDKGLSPELLQSIIDLVKESEGVAWEKGKKHVPFLLMKRYMEMKKSHFKILPNHTKQEVLRFNDLVEQLKKLNES